MKTKPAVIVASVFISCLSALTLVAQSSQPMMKAAVIHEHGGPDVFKYEDVARPEPKEDEVLVRVIAAAVNPVDTYIRQGMRSKGGQLEQPMIIGYDIAGVVERVGANVKAYRAGDEVYAYLAVPRGGGYAEFAIAKEGEMSLKPKSIDFEKASAVPLAATTAWQALIDTRQTGERPNRIDSWRIWWRWMFCSSNRKGSRRKGDRNCFDRKSGFVETTRGGSID